MGERWVAWAACLTTALVLGVSGCGKPADSGTGGGDGGAAPAGDGAASNEQAKIKAAFASLSEADRALATSQEICPVGGKLGTMGTPVKVDVEGRTVFLCCEGCRGEIEKDPAKYLAVLDGKQPAGDAHAGHDHPAGDESHGDHDHGDHDHGDHSDHSHDEPAAGAPATP